MGVLEGRVCAITGAGRGIGRGIARGLAAEGASLVLAARSESELREAAAEITAAGSQVLTVRTEDVAIAPDLERWLVRIVRQVPTTRRVLGPVSCSHLSLPAIHP